MLKRSPHAQWLGRSFRGRLYLIRNESLNSCLLRAKPWSLSGVAFSQELAPLSLDCITKNSTSGGRDASMLSILDLAVSVLIACCILFRSSTGCLKKKTLWKFNRLLCITNFLHRTKELLFGFSLIPFLNRNDEKWPHILVK
jgi:hypothetical protein